MVGFGIETLRVGGLPAVRVRGEVDVATAPLLREALLESLAQGHTDLIVDLSSVQFMDIAGLHVLEEVGHHLQARAGRLILRQPSRVVVRLLQLRQSWTTSSPWHIEDLPLLDDNAG